MNRRTFIKFCIVCAGGGGIGFHHFSNINSDNDDFLHVVEISLADHCNLNCKYCSHFSPIADSVFYDLEKFEKDLSKLSEVTGGNILNIALMGGEPLLNPNLQEYTKISRKYFHDSEIKLYTNGILLDKMDESFWQNLVKYDIKIRPSFYNININFDPIFEKADKI